MLRILLSAIVVACIAIAVPSWLNGRFLSGSSGPEPNEPNRQAARDTVSPASGRQVAIAIDQSGHYQAEFRINGRKIDGLIDTGASLIAINRSTARRLGVSVTPRDFRHVVTTANGTVAAARVVLRRVELQSIRIDKVQALVLDDDALGMTLIGMSFLNRLASYRVTDGILTLHR